MSNLYSLVYTFFEIFKKIIFFLSKNKNDVSCKKIHINANNYTIFSFENVLVYY